MQSIAGYALVLVGASIIALASRLVRYQARLHFSVEDLAATTGLRHRRVQLWKFTGYIANDTLGGFLVYMGIRLLIS